VVYDPYWQDTILVPNVITPNGDGRNEMFTVFGAAREGFRLTVFNRWGMELFTTTDPKRGWMGKAGTDPVPEGTYYYVTTYRDPCGGTDGTISQQGHVTVLR